MLKMNFKPLKWLSVDGEFVETLTSNLIYDAFSCFFRLMPVSSSLFTKLFFKFLTCWVEKTVFVESVKVVV